MTTREQQIETIITHAISVYQQKQPEGFSSKANALLKARQIVRNGEARNLPRATWSDSRTRALVVSSRTTSGVSYLCDGDRCTCPAYVKPIEAGDAPKPCWHRALAWAVFFVEDWRKRQRKVQAVIVEHGVQRTVDVQTADRWVQAFEAGRI